MSDNKPLAFKLSSLVDGKEFDGMAEGEFSDMYGRGVQLNGKYFAEFAKNTTDAIEATRTDGGEIVGLPIDAQGHENGDGAGWIVAVRHIVRDGVNLIRFTPKWTSIGRELIDGGIRRMFSPTVDTTNRVILGGSLTNWPATRTKSGRTILRPIELEGVKEMEEEQVLVQEQVTEAVELPPEPEPQESPAQLESLLASDGAASQVRELIRAQVAAGVTAELERIRQENDVDQYVAQLSLPAKRDDVRAFLLGLSDEQRRQARELFSAFSAALAVDFSERGHGAELKGRAQLSADIKRVLSNHVASGGTVAEFFEINKVDLGSQADYDLSDFEQEEK